MKTALIIALILLLVGALLIGASFALLQKNPMKENNASGTVYSYGMDCLPKEIQITTMSSRVEIYPITGDEWRVECEESETLYHTVEVVDGVLTIKQVGDEQKWYEYISIFNGFQGPGVIVYLPVGVYNSLNIQTVSGSIKVEEGFTFEGANLESTSSSIYCASHIAGDLHVKNTSGSITVIGGVDGNLIVAGVSGGIEIKNATPTTVDIKNTSGGIDLINVVCSGACKIENGSSSIKLENCDAASFYLKTVSGGIRASILSGKTFDCSSTSGGVNVPENREGGTFYARTTSGGIRVTVAE